MATTLTLSPVTRVEGHLDVEVTVETQAGVPTVVDARCAGPMFRGFETLLRGRDPRDATHLTQRICGVCPISHGMAACLALEDAFGVVPAPNGRIIRNLVLGANYIQSHILHFYHLMAVDYIDTTGLLDMPPWTPRHTTADMIRGPVAEDLVAHYLQALVMRRKAHRMAAIFAGKMPMATNMVPGGSTATVTAGQINDFAALLAELRTFIDNAYVGDAQALASPGLFDHYFTIGAGCDNLLAYGVFRLDEAGTCLLDGGTVVAGTPGGLNDALIREYVSRAWFSDDCNDLPPDAGQTIPQTDKPGAYSFIKAPRYDGAVYEAGPLARMAVNGLVPARASVMDRIVARALETRVVAAAMDGWLEELQPDQPAYTHADTPASAVGMGLTEAPRGALGHWVSIEGGVIDHYQVITPTAWNASPADGAGVAGAIEQALISTPVADLDQPVEVLRVVHSFDPCLACAVHLARPNGPAERFLITSPA